MQPIPLLHITYHLLNDPGITVHSGNKPRASLCGIYSAVCRIPAIVEQGIFPQIVHRGDESLATYWKEDVASFNVMDTAQRETHGWA